jgi:hypothetical protein
MRAMTVVPGQRGTAGIEEAPDPGMQVGALLGTVNAGRRHWEQAVEALATADPGWLGGLITRRVPLTFWTEALDRQPEDIKVVADLTV